MIRKRRDCLECGDPFLFEPRKGPPPQRCPPCRTERNRQKRIEISRRYREADPQRARDQYNRYNRKRLADPEYRRRKNDERILRDYGISREQYEDMLAEQGGVCAICGGQRNGAGKFFHIDHCHDSKKVRGLLCGKCNTAIGLLDDDPERAEALAQYLRR